MNEHQRFVNTRTRRIPGLPPMDWVRGKAILVTGGTGCIGSRLLRELSQHEPARLVSVSRTGTSPWPAVPGTEYRKADIRDYPALLEAFDGDWDAVFHSAAQRDPGQAEQRVQETVTTNVFGSANVLRAAEARGVGCVVFASTGKALRPYSPDVYTATKRMAEWLLASSAVPIRGAVRFTHVVDNSIFYARLRNWCQDGSPIKLHGKDIAFYVQSALEAAELLLGAAATCQEGHVEVHSITDLGMPVSLYDLAVQTREDTDSSSEIMIKGYDRGYEAVPFPGLYDPLTAVDVSPLINAFEAAESWEPYPGVDAFPLQFAANGVSLERLAAACQSGCGGVPDNWEIRKEMHAVSWDVMRASMAVASSSVAGRVSVLCKPHEPLQPPHDQMLDIIRARAESYSGPGAAI